MVRCLLLLPMQIQLRSVRLPRVARRGTVEFRLLGLLNFPRTNHLRMARLVHKSSLIASLRPGDVCGNEAGPTKIRALVRLKN